MTEPVGDPPVPPVEPDPPADPPLARTFTPDDVERIVKERLARAKATPPDDYEALKAKASKFDELDAANKSELEKANERAETAERERAAAIERSNLRLVEAAILTEATSARAIKPEHLHRLIDTGEVTVGDDGQVTGVKEAVEGFLKANPEYVGTGRPGGSADQGARGGGKQITREQLSSMTREDRLKAHNEGRLAHLLDVN